MTGVKNNTEMRIEVWSDFLCPYCYVGERNLKEALRQFAHQDKVKVIHRSFELQPDAPRIGGVNALDKQSADSVKSWERMKVYASDTAGLDYDIDNIHVDNTFDAHRLMKLAEKHGKDDELSERLFAAHFTQGKNIADKGVLTDIADAVGLDNEKVLRVLDSDEYGDRVRQDEQDALVLNFEYIPAYYVNRKYGINGVKSADDILRLLNDAWNNVATADNDHVDGPACGIHGCD